MGGLLRSVNLKIEIDLPSYMVYTQFGYTNAQTRVAQFLSAAMQYAADVIPSLNSCDQLGTLRYQYRNAFMSYLRDPDNMEEYLGTSFGIFMKENFYEQNVCIFLKGRYILHTSNPPLLAQLFTYFFCHTYRYGINV